MPIEIRELHIKVSINAPQADAPAGAGGGGNTQTNMNEEDKQALVAECVEQVLLVLEAKTER
jgi:hypothetical protein